MNTPPAPFEDVTGAVLIGGKSRRMGGCDKVLLPYKGRPLAAHICSLFTELFPRVLLIGHCRPELEDLGLECVSDLTPGKGVLGGIYTALASSETPLVFVAGADMPLITPSLISELLEYRHEADAVIPRGPRGVEPLCAIYSSACKEPVRKNLQKGILKIMPALEGLTVLSPAITADAGEPDPFVNINYPGDVKLLED